MNRILCLALLALTLAACGGGGGSKSAADIATQLKAAGAPIGDMVVYTAESDPNKLLGRPKGYTSKVNFHDTRLKAIEDLDIDGGGSVEVFPTAALAKARKDYLDAIHGSNILGTEYTYLDGTAVLRLSSGLTPDQAKEYEGRFK